MKGANFITLHELFDKISGEVGGHVDDMAERITALGGTAEGTIQAVVGRSKLPAYPLGLAVGRAHLEALAGAVARFGKSVRKAIDETAPEFYLIDPQGRVERKWEDLVDIAELEQTIAALPVSP